MSPFPFRRRPHSPGALAASAARAPLPASLTLVMEVFAPGLQHPLWRAQADLPDPCAPGGAAALGPALRNLLQSIPSQAGRRELAGTDGSRAGENK